MTTREALLPPVAIVRAQRVATAEEPYHPQRKAVVSDPSGVAVTTAGLKAEFDRERFQTSRRP